MRRHLGFALAFLITAVLPPSAAANHIGNIQFEFPSNSHLAFGTRAHVTFDYNITNPGGARISVQPMTGGVATPNYSYSGSVLLPVGAGSDDNWITINSGDAVVDHYRLAMFTPDWSTQLLEIILPIRYFYGENGAFNIRPDHTQPSWLAGGERLYFEVDTQVADPAGALLHIRPFTDGSLTPGYGATGAFLPTGFGTTSQYFTFNSPPADVDEIRVRMVSNDQSVTYLEFFVPVDFHWRDQGLSNIELSPPPPAWLPTGTIIDVDCDYTWSDPGAFVQIFAIGYSDGAFVPMQTYGNSGQLYATSGTAHMFTQYTGAEPAGYDALKLSIRNDAYENLLLEWLPVEYRFGPNMIYNVTMTPAAPAVLSHDEYVNLTFDYTTTESGGCRLYNLPMTDGAVSPDFGVSGSILYPVGTGSGTSYFRIREGDVQVDQILLKMTSADQAEVIFQYTFDTLHIYGDDGYVTRAPEVAPDAAPALTQNFPNPFNPTTTIAFTMPEAGDARVGIFDLQGRHVLDLFDGPADRGENRVVWSGRDEAGRMAPAGTYFYRLITAEGIETRKMVLVK